MRDELITDTDLSDLIMAIDQYTYRSMMMTMSRLPIIHCRSMKDYVGGGTWLRNI